MLRLILPSVFLVAATTLGQADPLKQTDQTRPFEDLRQFIGVVPAADGFDLYWLRTNELIRPVMNRIYKTSFSHDGRRLRSVVIHEAGVFQLFAPRAATTTNGLLVFWEDYLSERGVVHVSRVEGERLVDTGTRLIGIFNSASIQVRCGAGSCIAIWETNDRTHGAFFAEDGTMIGEIFELPGRYLLPADPLSVSPAGVFLFRHMLGERFATFIDRGGRLVFETRLPIPPFSRISAVSYDGERYLVFWDERRGVGTTEGPRDVWSLTVTRSGDVHDVRVVASSEPGPRSWLTTFNAVWTGHEFLLAGARWIDYVPDMVAMRFDAALQPIASPLVLPRRERFPGEFPFLARVGDRVVIGWLYPSMQIAVYAHGGVTRATEVEPPLRRRAASR